MPLKLKSLFSLLDSNPSEQDCIDYLENITWKGKMPPSPCDPSSKVYKCKNNRYKCKKCGKCFTTRSLTVFRHSRLSLKKIFFSLYLFVSRKKGISSCQLSRELDITQKSSWRLLNKLRGSLEQSNFIKRMLEGTVEIDETFIGGKNGNRHWNKKVPNSQGRSWKDKVPVWGAIERNGNLICQAVPNTKQITLEPIIRANVKEGSNVFTDEWLAYKNLGKWFNHQIVNHRIKQYVNGKATTNSIENPWSHLKRMIYGTYHWVSKKHLQGYADEFTFRFNTRKYSGQERFDLALASAVGKCSTYEELISC